jgi:hypothetical protein
MARPQYRILNYDTFSAFTIARFAAATPDVVVPNEAILSEIAGSAISADCDSNRTCVLEKVILRGAVFVPKKNRGPHAAVVHRLSSLYVEKPNSRYIVGTSFVRATHSGRLKTSMPGPDVLWYVGSRIVVPYPLRGHCLRSEIHRVSEPSSQL